ASTLKSPSYTKSVSWQHYQPCHLFRDYQQKIPCSKFSSASYGKTYNGTTLLK
ncbi:transposase, partial [Shigella boydii]